MNRILISVLAVILVAGTFGCSEPLSTREKGAAVGTLGGAGLGAIIGSFSGNAGAGAGIGAAVGLLGGALIGNQKQKQQKKEEEQRRQMERTNAEIRRQQAEIDRLKRQREY